MTLNPKYTDFVNNLSSIRNSVLSPIILIYLKLFSGLAIGKGAYFAGRPIIFCRQSGKIEIGNGFKGLSNSFANSVGIYHPLIISAVGKNVKVKIGNNVGLSGVSINCRSKITIGDNVIIGGGTAIWDTDFHPSDISERRISPNMGKTLPIVIEDEVFIGARAIILKGVTIGARSVIAAGAVVHKSVPSDSIVYGNPMIIRPAKSNN